MFVTCLVQATEEETSIFGIHLVMSSLPLSFLTKEDTHCPYNTCLILNS